MSDATTMPEDRIEQPQGAPPRKPGLLADPVVRSMVYVSVGLVILFLATVVGVLATGIASPTGPRSVAERQLMIAATQAEGAVGDGSAPYVNALIAVGNLPAARVELAQARASVNSTAPLSDLDLAEARLSSAGEEYDKAVLLADKAMKGFKAEAAAKDLGPGEDYYNAALVKAYALVELKRYKDAVAAFDIYIKQNPTAADILIDRGNAKVALKDKTGAEKDFRAALMFVPYDEEAKAGLKKIGVAQ